jgi:predicted RNA-binding protein YlxR (DUF448 family)
MLGVPFVWEMSMSRKKHIPQRMCIACHARRDKRSLIRVVRLADGHVVVDVKGKQNGRGAYLCPQQSCWTQALARGHLNRALRTKLTEDEIAGLRAYAATLPDILPSDND